MRFLILAVVVMGALAQKNATAKVGPEAKEWMAKLAPKAGPKPNSTAEPKPWPVPKETPEPPPQNPVPVELRPAQEACAVAYPNVLSLPENSKFLLQPDSLLTDKYNYARRSGPQGNNATSAHAFVNQLLAFPNLLCQIGYRLRQETPAGKCSELCSLESTDSVSLWSTYVLNSGKLQFYYDAPIPTYTSYPEAGRFSVQSTWKLTYLAAFANSPSYDADLDLADPAVLGTCMIGCQLAADAKAGKPAAGGAKQAAGPQVGAGVAAGAGGIILLAGVGAVVSRRLKRNSNKPQQKAPETTIAL